MEINNNSINVDNFPMVGMELLERDLKFVLQNNKMDTRWKRICLVYFCQYKEDFYIDIYLINNYLSKKINRGIIYPGHRMDNEALLYDLVSDEYTIYYNKSVDKYIEFVNSKFSYLNMKNHSDLGLALFHTYFGSLTGANKLLLSQGLDQIAINRKYMNNINENAQNIEEIMDIPEGFLKLLNNKKGIIILLEMEREELINVYKKHTQLIDDRYKEVGEIGYFAISYLLEVENELVDEELTEYDMLWEKLDYRDLQYDYPLEEMKEEIEEYIYFRKKLEIEDNNKLYPVVQECKDYEEIRIKGFELHRLYYGSTSYEDKYINDKEELFYHYENEYYEIKLPGIKELIQEAGTYNNWTLIHILGDCIENKNGFILMINNKKNDMKGIVQVNDELRSMKYVYLYSDVSSIVPIDFIIILENYGLKVGLFTEDLVY